MIQYPASLLKDAYKVFHPLAYNPSVEQVHSNFTNRSNKHSNIKNNQEVVFFGLQRFIIKVLVRQWNETFFRQPKDVAVGQYSRVVNAMLGKTIDVAHMEALHDLGYLPLHIKALPEGTLVPYGVPCLTVTSTVDGFGWVSNMIETALSAELWGMCTSSTTAFAYRKRFEKEPSLRALGTIPFMGHDFSYRGMFGTEAAAMSGAGHLTSFVGSDTIPAALLLEEYYGARIDEELVFASVDATEHSVMCSYGNTGELDSLKHLMTDITPTGILSVVSDTWDFWKLVTEYLPQLKNTIMEREGTVVIRPDSGDPVKILTGYKKGFIDETGMSGFGEVFKWNDGKWYERHHWSSNLYGDYWVREGATPISDAEVKGLVECLWDTFGGTVQESTGLKLLDSHIGAIYGDSITLDRQDKIITRLVDKGFVPSVVLGIGSFTYQYVTRDTNSSAMKATDTVQDGKHVPIFKDPKTDQSKKSAKGLLMVVKDEEGKLVLRADVTPEEESSTNNELKTVFLDGYATKNETLSDIRERINSQL